MAKRKQPHEVVHAWIDAQPKEPTSDLYEALARLTLGVALSQFVPPIILYPLGKRVHTILQLTVNTCRECGRDEFAKE